MILLPLLLACAGAGDKEDTDSAPIEDTGADTDPCAVETSATGEAVGNMSCTDGICEVEAGPFWMGDIDPFNPERCPQRQVTLSAFAIDETEVTLTAWEACVEEGACAPFPDRCESEVDTDDTDAHPVTCADYDSAAAYCAWAGGRLPTEAEWEKASRGTEGADWPWGDRVPDCNDSNYRFSASYCFIGVIAVGSFPDARSPYGLLDTVGNAWEWIADWYDIDYYQEAPDEDPPGPEACDLGEEAACNFRVIRGGAFNTTLENTRSASRSSADPAVIENNIGIRCAYDR